MAYGQPFNSLDEYLIGTPSDVDGELDDGWGGKFAVKGREIHAAILFADIKAFSKRTLELTSTETLVFVNTFFSWVTHEALRGRPGVVDKYIGDEIMIVFSTEFGSEDPFEDAVRAGLLIGQNDVHDFSPHIGIASGPITVGYVGTPRRFNASVFGQPVAMAARCASVEPLASKFGSSTVITFPAVEWEAKNLDEVYPPRRLRGPDGREVTERRAWNLSESRLVAMKNLPDQQVRQLTNLARRFPSQSADDRARDGMQYLAEQGRYWPQGSRA